MRVKRRQDHTWRLFFKRTVSAQIHLLTCFFAIVAIRILLPLVEQRGALHYWAVLIFGATSILLFAVSSIFHFMMDGFEMSEKLEAFMERLDHWAIYFFIAGTYTPFIVNTVYSDWRNFMLMMVWSLAIVGVFYTALKSKLPMWAQSRVFYTSVFVLMGWTAIVRMDEVSAHLNSKALFFLFAGGAAYIVGAFVYATKRPRLMSGFFGFHELWHVLVTMGFIFHYKMIESFYY